MHSRHADALGIALVIAADHLQRHALVRAVHAGGIPVAGFAGAAELMRARQPDETGCVVLDVDRPGPDGLAAQDLLQRAGFDQPLIVLTGYGEVSLAVRALQRGAFDLLEKPCPLPQLLASVEQALVLDRGQRGSCRERATFRGRRAQLTPRERAVMALLVQGKANKVVAHELGISAKTVEVHRARVMEKLAVGSFAELVRLDALHGAG